MKMDCSKTDNYFKEKGRMLESIKADCSYCILASAHNGTGFSCCIFEGKHLEKAISIMQKWSDEHQQKTYKEDFFEKFPNAPKYENGYPVANPKYIYGDIFENTGGFMICWDKVMEGVVEEMADVEIMLEQLKHLLRISDEQINTIKLVKIKRTIDIIEQEG